MEAHDLEGLTESLPLPAGAWPGWEPAPASGRPLQPGDCYTIAGVYRRRTWWEWLTRAPRRLQVWVVRRRP